MHLSLHMILAIIYTLNGNIYIKIYITHQMEKEELRDRRCRDTAVVMCFANRAATFLYEQHGELLPLVLTLRVTTGLRCKGLV